MTTLRRYEFRSSFPPAFSLPVLLCNPTHESVIKQAIKSEDRSRRLEGIYGRQCVVALCYISTIRDEGRMCCISHAFNNSDGLHFTEEYFLPATIGIHIPICAVAGLSRLRCVRIGGQSGSAALWP